MKMRLLILALTCLAASCYANNAQSAKEGRIFPLFNYVRFANERCTSDNNNGVCYTADECSQAGGTAGNECGGGFGICCIFQPACGSTTKQRTVNLQQTTTITTLATPCTYTICPVDASITRIKYEFTTLTLAAPGSIPLSANDGAVADVNGQSIIGNCLVDTFNINNAGGSSPPQICGTNSGQHMIVDANAESCQRVTIAIGGSDATTARSWNIVVNQHDITDEEAITGPSGCLQYFTTATGRFANYGIATSVAAAAFGGTQTHLSNQHYNACFRRVSGNCNICYVTAAVGVANSITMMSTFGLSLSDADDAVNSLIGTACSLDYIEIPGATSLMIAQMPNGMAAISSRFCGRHLDTASAIAAATTQTSICTRSVPFVVTVNYDAFEVVPPMTGAAQEGNEAVGGPAGTIGFDLDYRQSSIGCP